MICKECGNEIKDGEIFCGKCGRMVNDKIEKNYNDNKIEPIKIKLMHLGFGIIIVFVLLILGVYHLYNNSKSSNVSTNQNNIEELQKQNNKILDIIDQENQEFKIDGMELVNAIDNVYKAENINYGYEYMGTVDGIKQYGISRNILAINSSIISYPAILVGVSENTGKVVAICVGDPYDDIGYKNSMTSANYNQLKKALNNLGYNELWNTISKMKDSFEANQPQIYEKTGLNGVYHSYIRGYSNITYGINYIMYKATK